MIKPRVSLLTVEESLEVIDQELLSAYRRTTYCVAGWGLRFRIGTPNDLLVSWLNQRFILTFGFITAWNPRSELKPLDSNRRANEALVKYLKKQKLICWPALHLPDDHEAPTEESFFVENIQKETLLNAGRLFGQNAVVYFNFV